MIGNRVIMTDEGWLCAPRPLHLVAPCRRDNGGSVSSKLSRFITDAGMGSGAFGETLESHHPPPHPLKGEGSLRP